MNNHSLSHFDIHALVHQVMIENGFRPDVPPDVTAEVQALDENHPHDAVSSPIQDLRSRLWSSIDNQESRDLDQVEYAEKQPNGDIRILVGIADVDAFVPEGSAMNRHAARNATSVY